MKLILQGEVTQTHVFSANLTGGGTRRCPIALSVKAALGRGASNGVEVGGCAVTIDGTVIPLPPALTGLPHKYDTSGTMPTTTYEIELPEAVWSRW